MHHDIIETLTKSRNDPIMLRESLVAKSSNASVNNVCTKDHGKDDCHGLGKIY